MEDYRPDPDQLLEQVKAGEKEEEKRKKGKLKIFFGYAAGVGKTYAMLEAAHKSAEEGVDVVAGYIEPHARPETMALMEGLSQLPVLEIPYRNIILREFNLSAALKRKPQLILVDELAHTNAEGCIHRKRYQDVQELLKAGINVYTTVNVQHLESLNDIVASITGITVTERIPDFVFDAADQVELVDIEPQELMERLKKGKVYGKVQAETALAHFFTVDNLTALREIALRRTADLVNHETEKNREQNRDSEYYTGEHILVCLSSSPSNAKVIRAAARMAAAFKARFSAVHVEEAGQEELSKEDALRLRMNQKLAEQLGANVVTLYGGGVVRQIAEYARVSGVSKIVLGRSYTRRSFWAKNETFSDQLTAIMPRLEIYLIPDGYNKPYRKKKKKEQYSTKNRKIFWKDLLVMTVVMGVSSMVAFLFRYFQFDEANIVTIYILGVLLTALFTEKQIYSLLVSALSVLSFNLFFTPPLNTLWVYEPGYLVTFLIMFLVGFLMASVAKKVKSTGRQAVRKAWSMELLLDTNRRLQMTAGEEQIMRNVCIQLERLLDRDIIYYSKNPAEVVKPWLFPREKESGMEQLRGKDEEAVAAWTYQNNKHAGASTNTLPGAKGLYLAVRCAGDVFGVVGIHLAGEYLSTFEEGLVNAILNEAALALEKEKNVEDKNQARLQIRQEQLRSNLLRSISHDLRTPLTSISGNSGMLKERGASLSEEQRQQLYEDIYDDSVWLYNLVENLLFVTKIENGSMELVKQPELMEDVIREALSHIKNRLKKHKITVLMEDEFLLAFMEARLIMQVIVNLVDNAVKYTPENTEITISAKRYGNRVYVVIADQGEGIPDDRKEKIFQLFYTAEDQAADGTRSMGVGLSLCRSIVEAHGGTIKVRDNVPKGSRFIFDLQAADCEVEDGRKA